MKKKNDDRWDEINVFFLSFSHIPFLFIARKNDLFTFTLACLFLLLLMLFFLVFCCVWLIKTMKNSICCYSHNEQMEESVTNRGKSNYFISCRKGGRQLCLIAFNCCNKHDMPKNSIGHNRVYWLRKVSNQNVFLTQKIPNQEANIFRKQNQFPFSKWNIINDDEFLFRIFIKKHECDSWLNGCGQKREQLVMIIETCALDLDLGNVYQFTLYSDHYLSKP